MNIYGNVILGKFSLYLINKNYMRKVAVDKLSITESSEIDTRHRRTTNSSI